MATHLNGPAIHLAQFAGDVSPCNSWDTITQWAAGHGLKGGHIIRATEKAFDDLAGGGSDATQLKRTLGI